MKVLLYFVLLYLGSSVVLCESRDELVERLLQETTELRKETMELRQENIKVWEKIKQLEVGKDMTQHKSKRLLDSMIPQPKNKAAFSASLTKHMLNVGNYQAIIFDNVFTNDGNMYSPYTGVFTAPTNGTYFFISTVMSHSGQYLETEICLNGNSLVLMYSLDNSSEQGTNSVVLALKEGDRVWVRHHGTRGSNVYGGHWSSFSGFQITG
ncbi:complement C1q-like protein 3 [Ruditapes philippinarum]|uniref:complement C1q-like protein 3 n=1 Tax=Ruditapes philippinarum TaxID=129788 RepID=UPI00295A9786|nr:complement C1q-like protein 3 [Ruditapes philippinarum]